VYIVIERSYVDTDSQLLYMTLTEGQSVPLKCLSHGGYPQPSISILLADEDITSQFQTAHTTDLTGMRGLRTLHYRSSCWNDRFTPRAQDDGRVLRCVVHISGVGSNSTNVTLRVLCKYVCDVTSL